MKPTQIPFRSEIQSKEKNFYRILGLPLLPSAFGFMTAIQGTAALLGPPLAGALVDEADSLSASLQATGSLLLLASMVFIIASFQNHRREKRSGYEDI